MKTRLALLVMMIVALGLHVALGEVHIDWGALFSATLMGEEVNDLHATVLRDVRVPRALMAMAAGTSLGLSLIHI